ncbi:MAG: flavodoxin family protein [Deltaproteobacteria bacterium]|jgi:multimeric flavodoxin WrbA|nr:flavodoxin family protein [Deltaproteobacteria bacterium]
MSYVLAFSGSPIHDGTIEKGLKLVMDTIEADNKEFIRLYNLKLNVCVGCKKCAINNRCVLNDDLNPILEKICASDAFILSGYPSFGSLNAITKIFIERLWPLRHNFHLTRGKIGSAVVAGRVNLNELDIYFMNYFSGYLGMDFKGTLILKGNLPCMTCGFGEDCEVSGFLQEYGEGAKVTPDKFYNPWQDTDAQKRAESLGNAISLALTNKKGS